MLTSGAVTAPSTLPAARQIPPLQTEHQLTSVQGHAREDRSHTQAKDDGVDAHMSVPHVAGDAFTDDQPPMDEEGSHQNTQA